MDDYKVRLDVFEGPLDLLLHLIKELEIDIYDIPMKVLTRQYMEYIEEMKELEINVASEYLLMASELLKIKSHTLLPGPAYAEEPFEDPRESLMEQLIEYQNFKQYAEQLSMMKQESERLYIKPPEEYEEVDVSEDEMDVSISELLVAYQKVRSRVALDQPKNVVINHERYTRKMAESFISEHFTDRDSLAFHELFNFNESKSKVVAVFIVLLDYVKEGQMRICRVQGGDYKIERLFE